MSQPTIHTDTKVGQGHVVLFARHCDCCGEALPPRAVTFASGDDDYIWATICETCITKAAAAMRVPLYKHQRSELTNLVLRLRDRATPLAALGRTEVAKAIRRAASDVEATVRRLMNDERPHGAGEEE